MTPATSATLSPLAAAPPALDSDGELMAAVAAGDRDAFGRLVERHKDRLIGYLARLTGSRDRAEDLAQESFLRLFRQAGSYREQGQLAALLFRIATNLLRSEERRSQRWHLLKTLFGGHLTPSPAASGESRLLLAEEQQHLVAALSRLPIDWRSALLLAEIEGWPLADIARALGCREGTVKSRLFRARARLRAELAPYRLGGLP